MNSKESSKEVPSRSFNPFNEGPYKKKARLILDPEITGRERRLVKTQFPKQKQLPVTRAHQVQLP